MGDQVTGRVHDATPSRRGREEPVVERGDPAAIDRLGPLWKALLEHQRGVYSGIAQRSPDESWRRRSAEYARWLAEGTSFYVVARRGDELLGYAMVEVRQASPMWDLGDRVADLQTLVVLPAERRRHLGRALLDAVDGELQRLGIEHVLVGVMAGNDEAVRFYEGRGFVPYATVLRRGSGPHRQDDGPEAPRRRRAGKGPDA